MRIIVLSTPVFRFGPHGCAGYSGLEQLAWLIAKGLAQRGHQTALVAPDGSECPGVQVIGTGPAGQHSEQEAYGGDKRRGWDGYWPMLQQFDAIIDHTWSKNSATLKLENRLPAPILGVCHAPVNTMFEHPMKLPDKVIQFVCISEDQRLHFENLFGRKARVAYNGVDLDWYKTVNMPRSDRFLFLARFSSIKGPDLAIEACREAGVGLDMIGDTTITHEPELAMKCKALADGKRIKIIGNQNRGACVFWFSRAHCLLHPNERFREPFGLSPVEAMACGTPVIAWDNGAMRETIGPGCGWLVDSRKSFLAAIHEAKKDIPETMRRNCREWVKRFSVEAMVSRYEQLCREAIDSPW